MVLNSNSRYTSVTELLHQLQWRQLQERRIIARLAMFYKAVHGLAACPIPQSFPAVTPRTRASHSFQYLLPQLRVDAYKYTFFPRTIRIWNILPSEIVQITDTNTFKAQLQQQFSSGQMYVVAPKGQYHRPRLGSSSQVSGLGPVY